MEINDEVYNQIMKLAMEIAVIFNNLQTKYCDHSNINLGELFQ